MAWNKRVSVGFFLVESPEENYFNKFYDDAEIMLSTNTARGGFEGGNLKYLWQITESVEAGRGVKGYLFTLVRERKGYPLWFTENGVVQELLPLGNAVLGDIAYALFCPAQKTLLSFSLGGGSTSGYKRMLGQFAAEGLVQLFPLCEQGVDERILNWDSYKKVSLHLDIPTREEVANFQNTKYGELTKLLGHLDGKKMDISISSDSKQTLSNLLVKDFLTEQLANDFCTSLVVRGSDFENGAPEQFDLKKAQLKYSETIEIEGSYISETQAKQVLLRALSSKSSEVFK